MLLHVEAPPLALAAYRRCAGRAALERIAALAAPLRGLRVVHINATAQGGGVAEILRSLVPLSRSVGLDARWSVLPPDDAFFEVTKLVHNYLQGRPGKLSPRDKRVYRGYLEGLAAHIHDLEADVWVVHDPQPLPLRTLVPLRGAALWRCHLDCSTPNGGARQYLLPWAKRYDVAVFSMPQYVLDGLPPGRVRISYPALDPLAPKNRPMAHGVARDILAGLGLDPHRPLVAQVGRFDPWKDPWQALEAYRLAKRQIPGLQLALVGTFGASDDPEAPHVYADVARQAGADPDVHLYTDPLQVGDREINAIQSAATAILQRSVREGFGLTVTEAMWKRRPVIATPVGGIAAQIRHGHNGFLVDSAEECAEHVVRVACEPRLANRIGHAARRSVRERFLLPRLLEDELQLYRELVDGRAAGDRAA
jgi:trehalose synthase